MTEKEKQFWPIEGVTRKEVIKSQNDTRFNFLRTCSSRRIMIGVISFIAFVVALSSMFPAKYSSYIEGIGGLSLLLGYLLLRTSVRHIADSPDELLDERQIALRGRSYLHSYRIISSLFILILIALFIRIDLSESPFDISELWGTGTWFSLIMFMAGLPSTVVAWLDKGEDEF